MSQLARSSCPSLIGPFPHGKEAGLIVKAGTQVSFSLAGALAGGETRSELTEFARRD